MDPLERLRRTDKWFLAGGKGAIYAPPFPRALRAPGFWDECFLADIKLRRLFTVVLCEPGGRPVSLESRIRSWRPDRLNLEHRGAGRTIRETRCVLPCQAWVSSLTLVSGALVALLIILAVWQ